MVTASKIPVPEPMAPANEKTMSRGFLYIRYLTVRSRTEEISEDGEGTDAKTTEGSSSGNVAVQDLLHVLVTVSGHDHLLVAEVLGNVLGR